MSDKKTSVTMTWTDWRGRKQTREVNQVIDARDFAGLAGYPWLIIAANAGTELSAADIYSFLAGQENMRRPLSWITRKRWMFRKKDATYWIGARPDQDDNQARAINIIRAQDPKRSARDLVRILKEHGIERGKDWVLKHRCG